MTQAIRSTANVTSGYNVKSESSRDPEPTGLNGRYRAGVIAGALMLLLILGVLYSSTHHEQHAVVSPTLLPVLSVPLQTPVQAAIVPPAPVLKKRVKRLAPVVSYVNPDYGISFRYPRKFELLGGDALLQNDDGVGPVHMNFNEAGGEPLASVQLPAKMFNGTTFQSAGFNVSVNNNLTSDKCSQFASSATELSQGGSLTSSAVKVGASELEGATDTFGNSKYYHVFANGTCYEFELALFTVNSEAAGGLKPVNEDEVVGKLDKILASVTIQTPKIKDESGE